METIENLPKIDKKDFPLLENKFKSKNAIVYLDHAATTQKPIQVLEKIEEYMGTGMPLPRKQRFVERLKGLEFTSFDPRVQSQAIALAAALRT